MCLYRPVLGCVVLFSRIVACLTPVALSLLLLGHHSGQQSFVVFIPPVVSYAIRIVAEILQFVINFGHIASVSIGHCSISTVARC